MNISRLALKNWRNFRDVDIRLSDRVFIIGPNAAGKSNFLDAIRFLRDVAKAGGGLQRALDSRGGISKVRCLAARKEPNIEIEVDLGRSGSKPEWTYAIGITQQPRGRRQAELRFERVYREGVLLLERPDDDDKKDPLRLTQTSLEQINANESFREVASFLQSIRYLHLVPQFLRTPAMMKSGVSDEDPFGSNFLEKVAKTTEKTRRARLRQIEAALRAAVPNLKNLTDTTDEAGVPHLEATYEHWRPNAGRQREDQFSDGTLRLIGLFWSMLDGDAPLLLEEPELSLHVEIVKRIPSLISKLQINKRRQVIMSTHSPDLLSDKSIGGEETVYLTPGSEGTSARLASSDREMRLALEAGLSVADVVVPHTVPPKFENLSLFE